jgi:hypothetical protein
LFVQLCITTTETGDQIQFQTVVTSDISQSQLATASICTVRRNPSFWDSGSVCRADDPAERRSQEGGKEKEAKESILASKLMLSRFVDRLTVTRSLRPKTGQSQVG